MTVIGGIILLHTLVPHEHVEPKSNITIIHNHECSADLFGDIKLSFGTDHGDGHLEQFVKVVHTTPTPLLIVIAINDYSVNFTKEDYIFIEDEYRPVNIPPDPQRGPPRMLA